MTQAAKVKCEQLICTWAKHTLTGSGGHGAVARSNGWPFDTRSDLSGGLNRKASFLRQGTARHAVDEMSPTSLSFLHSPEGVLVLAKTLAGADTSGRPGRYIVHALLDPTNTLQPWDAMGAWMSGYLVDEWDADNPPNNNLPPFVVTSTSRPESPRSDISKYELKTLNVVLPRLIEALWYAENIQGRVVVRVPDFRGASFIAHLIAACPLPLARQLTFSTFEVDPNRCEADLCFAVPPFSEPVTSRDDVLIVDDSGRRHFTVPQNVTRMALEIIDSYFRKETYWQDLRADSFTAALEIQRVTDLGTGDPRTISTVDIPRVLDSPHGRQWLEDERAQRRVVEAVATGDRSTSTMLDSLVQHQVSRTVTYRLTEEVTEILMDFAVTGKWRRKNTDLDGLLALAEQLTDDVSTVLDPVIDRTTETLRKGNQPAQPTACWRCLQERKDNTNEVLIAWAAYLDSLPYGDEARPGALSLRLVRLFFTGTPGQVGLVIGKMHPQQKEAGLEQFSRVLGTLLKRYPEHVAQVIDEALATTLTPTDLTRLCTELDVTSLPGLVETLLRCTRLPAGYLLTDLADLPWMTVGTLSGICERYWPDLVRSAGLSPKLEMMTPVSAQERTQQTEVISAPTHREEESQPVRSSQPLPSTPRRRWWRWPRR
jgi:hypothetical protein